METEPNFKGFKENETGFNMEETITTLERDYEFFTTVVQRTRSYEVVVSYAEKLNEKLETTLEKVLRTVLDTAEKDRMKGRLQSLQERLVHVLEGIKNIKEITAQMGIKKTRKRDDGIKLARITLPIFEGDIMSWRGWYESYLANVHKNSDCDDAQQKFHHLKRYIKGEPLELINHFQVTANNYDRALQALKDRYDNPILLIAAYKKELEELVPAAEDYKDQLRVYDAIVSGLSNLRSLKADWSECAYLQMIIQKFPTSTLMGVYHAKGKPLPEYTTDDLLLEISQVLGTWRYIRTMKASEPEKSESVSTVLVGGPSGEGRSTKGKQTNCGFCARKHKSTECRTYSTTAARRDRLVYLKACYACLGTGHLASTCGDRRTCPRCLKGTHHPSICMLVKGAIKRDRKSPETTQKTGTFLQTFTCFVYFQEKCCRARGVLDSGSTDSYMQLSLVERLRAKLGPARSLPVQTFGSTVATTVKVHDTTVVIASLSGRKRKVTLLTTECLMGHLATSPSPDTVFALLPDIQRYGDPDIFCPDRRRLEILLGNDVYYDFVRLQGHRRLDNGLVLLNTSFGWIPTGRATNNVPNSTALIVEQQVVDPAHQQLSLERTTPEDSEGEKQLSDLLVKLWNLETIGIKESELETISGNVLRMFAETHRIENGRYIVSWPWKRENKTLPTNYRMSVARLKSLLQRTELDTLHKLKKLFDEQEVAGIIEKVPRGSHNLTHYLPYKSVVRNEKIRVVYDASAKTKTGNSLNDLLHTGPCLIKNQIGLLIGFRIRPVALTADIEKAFHQIGLDEGDRDTVRFLWVKDPKKSLDDTSIVVYRFKRVPFGVVSSPFLLNMVIQEVLSKAVSLSSGLEKRWYELGQHSFYVDNLILSVNNSVEALQLYDTLTYKLGSFGFNLRDWASNAPDFDEAIAREKAISKVGPVSILGLDWNRELDTLSLRFQTPDLNLATKRMALQTYAQVYDPWGAVTPCTLALKLFVQDCWRAGVGWDMPLPPLMETRFRKLYRERNEILSIRFPRQLWTTPLEGCTMTLHVFSDASKRAYGCVHYLVKTNLKSQMSESALVYSKVRLAPCKLRPLNQLNEKTVRPLSKASQRSIDNHPPSTDEERSIPQLELLGATLGVRSSQFILSQLRERDVLVNEVYIWTDATTVLHWLHSSSVLPLFVENRIREIRQTPNIQIRYVPTADNPADFLTRGKRASELSSDDRWWLGPSWLTQQRLWPVAPSSISGYSTIVTSLFVARGEPKMVLELLTDKLEAKYSSWEKYVTVFKYVAIFSNFRRLKEANYTQAEEFSLAEIVLVRAIQLKYFRKELCQLEHQVQPKSQLDLFLDSNKIIRCRGRLSLAPLPLDTLHPMLLPRNCRLTDVLLFSLHQKHGHIGAAHLLATLRERFWVAKGRAKTNSVVRRCVICRRVSGGPYKAPPMPPLPRVRVSDVAPFLHIGLDCFGPFYVKRKNEPSSKVYGVIFTCLVTRAIHLELAEDLSGDKFVAAFIRFSSRRGVPKFVVSDNGQNFTFVQPLVGIRVKISDVKINNYLNDNRITWYFIPAYAPWYGGVYERMIGIVKICLRKALGKQLVDYTALETAFCQVESITNSRPLTYVSSEDTLRPITPNHFLLLRTCNVTEELEINIERVNVESQRLIAGYKTALQIVETYREAFHCHYLQALRAVHAKYHRDPRGSISFCPKKGDVVLLKEATPRSRWPMGVVVKVDDRQAIATVRTTSRVASLNLPPHRCFQQKIVQRSVRQLYPLELHPPGSTSVPSEVVTIGKHGAAASQSLDGSTPERCAKQRRLN